MAVLIDKSATIVEIWLDKNAIDSGALVKACERQKTKD
jgi:hypothetical protein